MSDQETPDPAKERDKRIAFQVTQLGAIKRLKENADYHLIFPPRLEHMEKHFHDSMCDPKITGEKLEYARARYLGARALRNLLDNLETAIESSLEAANEEDLAAQEPGNTKNSEQDVDKTFAITYGGWFDSMVTPSPTKE